MRCWMLLLQASHTSNGISTSQVDNPPHVCAQRIASRAQRSDQESSWPFDPSAAIAHENPSTLPAASPSNDATPQRVPGRQFPLPHACRRPGRLHTTDVREMPRTVGRTRILTPGEPVCPAADRSHNDIRAPSTTSTLPARSTEPEPDRSVASEGSDPVFVPLGNALSATSEIPHRGDSTPTSGNARHQRRQILNQIVDHRIVSTASMFWERC